MADQYTQAWFDALAQQNPDFLNWKQSGDAAGWGQRIAQDGDLGQSIVRPVDLGFGRTANMPVVYDMQPSVLDRSNWFQLPDGRFATYDAANGGYMVEGDQGQQGFNNSSMHRVYGADGSVIRQDDYTPAKHDDMNTYKNLMLATVGGLAGGAALGAFGGAGEAAAGAGEASATGAGYGAADYAAADAAAGMVPEYGSSAAYDAAVAGTAAPAYSSAELADAYKAYAANAASGSTNYGQLGQKLAQALMSGNGAPVSGVGASSGLPGASNSGAQAQTPKGVDLMPKFSSAPVAQNGYYDELGNSQNVMKLAQALRNPYGSY